MPVSNSQQPSVNVQVPVPTPVEKKPKRSSPKAAPKAAPRQVPIALPQPPRPQITPINFGGDESQLGAGAIMPSRPLAAVVLPWSPPPKKMGRKRYTGETTEEDFQKLLDKNPSDHDTRLVFADWLQERNDPRAEGYRALGMLRRQPQDHGYVAQWGRMNNKQARLKHALLHPAWWEATHEHFPSQKGLGGSVERWWTSHDSRRQADDAAALAFAGLSPRIKANILKSAQSQKMSRLPNKVVRYMASPIRAVNAGETAHQALTRILGNGTRGRPHEKRLGKTSYVWRDTDTGDIHVRLHNTNVVTAHPNGQVMMRTGGWHTPTTLRFIKGYSGLGASFQGGKFHIRHPQTGEWHEYEEGTPFPPTPKDTANDPVPERGRLTPDQQTMLRAHLESGDVQALGALGDSLAESGYPHTGALLSRAATGDPGVGNNKITEHHAQYQVSPVLGVHEFHFVPGRGKHDLHELHIQTPDAYINQHDGSDLPIPQQLRIVGSHPVPDKLSRRRVLLSSSRK